MSSSTFLRCGSALATGGFLLATSSALAAQTPDAQAVMPSPAAPAAVQPPASLEEIVVTARKRDENLQKTPISITAFSADALAIRQVSTIADIGKFTPNMSFESTANLAGSSGAATIFIRGIGQTDFTLTTDPGVGLYLDGVYISRSIGSLLDTLDLKSVQVLRGPQGTLFGKNTIGGAVVLTSAPPTHRFEGAIEGTTGSYNRADVRGFVNIPLSDSLAIRATGSYQSRDGYIRRVLVGDRLGDRNSVSGRIVAEYKPSSNFTATLAFDATRSREQGAPVTLLGVNVVDTPPATPADPLSFSFFANKILNGAVCGGPFTPTPDLPSCFTAQWVPSNPYVNYGTGANYSNLDVWGGALTLGWDLGPVAVKSITAYRHLSSRFSLETDASPLDYSTTADVYRQKQFSQELQFSGKGFDNKFKWLLGLYYLNEKGTDTNILTFPVADFVSGGSVDNDSYAAFGQVTYDLTRRLSVTLGGRYTNEKKRFTPDQYIVTDRTGMLAGPTGLSCLFIPTGNPDCNRILPFAEASVSAHEFTGSASIDYQLSRDILAYASYGRGFKSGGFTQRVFPPEPVIPSFQPEFVSTYEAGIKTELFDRKLRLNGAFYWSDYTDLQLIVNEGVAPKVRNAGKARIRGAELEAEAAVSPWLRLSGGLGYTDARYLQVDARAVGITTANRLPNTPKWTGNAGATVYAYRGTRGEVRLRGDWSYKGTHFKDAVNTPQLRQSGYSLFSASVTYEAPGARWSLSAGGTNLTDKRYLLSGYSDPVSLNLVEGAYARPREWFLRAGFKF